MLIDVELNLIMDRAPVVRLWNSQYRRRPTGAFRDAPARLTERQAVFYRNLIQLAEKLQSNDLPVDFELPDGNRV